MNMSRLILALLLSGVVAGCHSSEKTVPAARRPATKPSASPANDPLWNLLRAGGQVVLMRHAKTTPGMSDPPNFTLGECSTQRNLSDAGRKQAKAIGEKFKQRDVTFADVLASPYCRTLDTARLIAGRVEANDALIMLADDAPDRDARIAILRQLAAARPAQGNVLLVTHEPNITAITNLKPAMGEMVILTPDGHGNFRVAGLLHVAD
jgi:phosphohistidine phosphatase SixA